MFITFEGPEGSGKTTHLARLAAELRARGLEVLTAREPGGTPLGDAVRALLLDPTGQVAPPAEALLYAASRAQLVAEVIRPHLAADSVVLCDRYVDSTLAYQGYGRGLDLTLLRAVTQLATGGLQPHLTLFLDIEPGRGLARRAQSGRALDRLDAQTLDFHQRVYGGYQALMAAEPARWVRIDADREAEAVYSDVLAAVTAQVGG